MEKSLETIDIEMEYEGVVYRVRLTQRFIRNYDFGHTCFVVEDTDGNILYTENSTGAPPERKTERDVGDRFDQVVFGIIEDY